MFIINASMRFALLRAHPRSHISSQLVLIHFSFTPMCGRCDQVHLSAFSISRVLHFSILRSLKVGFCPVESSSEVEGTLCRKSPLSYQKESRLWC